MTTTCPYESCTQESCACRDEKIERLKSELNDFRAKLCLTFSERPYLDDGELQDNSCHPGIDYKRETIDSILGKIKNKQRKELERLNARVKELEKGICIFLRDELLDDFNTDAEAIKYLLSFSMQEYAKQEQCYTWP